MSTISTAWVLLGISTLFDAFGMVSLKHSNGFSQPLFGMVAIACFLISIWLMSISLRQIDMMSSYAVWAAASTVLIALLGIVFYGEIISHIKLSGIVFILIGVTLLNLGHQ